MRIIDTRHSLLGELCDDTTIPAGFEPIPDEFTIPDTEGKLIDDLRDAAALAKSNDILGALMKSVEALAIGNDAVAHAIADLTVTGREAHGYFLALAPQDSDLNARLAANYSDGELRFLLRSVSAVLDRAYEVLWIIHQGVNHSLKWLAVCGDCDPPHKAINVPPTGFAQHEIEVSVQATGAYSGHTVTTRFTVWDDDNRPDSSQTMSRTCPPVPVPVLSQNKRYLIYVHGLGSSLEECGRLATALAGSEFVLISMDLPNHGCAKLIDHINDLRDTNNEWSETDFPLLRFTEAFVVSFAKRLAASYLVSFKSRIAAVIGGSLGGNIALKLASNDHYRTPWLNNFIAWSPASVWSASHEYLRSGYGRTWNRMMANETVNARVVSIQSVYDWPSDKDPEANPGNEGSTAFTNAETWYDEGYEPCRKRLIDEARESARQNYHEYRRVWSQRLAAEQLLQSHVEPRGRVDALTGRVLLLAGDDDDYPGVGIFSGTRQLAVKAIATEGAIHPLEATGHSIHTERPRELAETLVSFLPAPYPQSLIDTGYWQSLGGFTRSTPAVGLNEDGSLEVFIRGEDEDEFTQFFSNRVVQTIRSRRQDGPNGLWAGGTWLELNDGLEKGTKFGKEIAVARMADGALVVFCALTEADRIASVWQDAPNGEFGDWATGDKFVNLIGGATDSAFAIRRFAEGGGPLTDTQLVLAGARTTGPNVHVRGQKRIGGWWATGKNVFPERDLAFEGTPTAINAMSGKTFILCRVERTHHVWAASLAGDHDWEEWNLVGGKGETLSTDVSAAVDASGDIYVVAKEISGKLVVSHNSGSKNSWTDWERHDVQIAYDAKPAIIRNPWGELQVFVRCEDGTIRTMRQPLGFEREWDAWVDLGGRASKGPVVAANANGMLSVFTVGSFGHVYVRTMPYGVQQLYRSAVRSAGVIQTLLMDSGETRTAEAAIKDIWANGMRYSRFEKRATKDLVVRAVLTIGGDEIPVLANEELGKRTIVAPPKNQSQREVTHVVNSRRGFGRRRLHNANEGWSVDEKVVFTQVLNQTHQYNFVSIDGKKRRLNASRHLDEVERPIVDTAAPLKAGRKAAKER